MFLGLCCLTTILFSVMTTEGERCPETIPQSMQVSQLFNLKALRPSSQPELIYLRGGQMENMIPFQL